LTPAQGNYTFAIIVVEYFTKWIEAKLLTNVSSATIKKFFFQNIICRYGVPRHITVDDDKYFDNTMFKEFYQEISTKVASASVYHPQSNGAVKKTNSLIFQAMKKILEGAKKGKWAEVMPTVVWSHTHNSLRGNKLHTISVNVRGRSNAARRDKAPKLASYGKKHTMP
jgi:hypothetical protein